MVSINIQVVPYGNIPLFKLGRFFLCVCKQEPRQLSVRENFMSIFQEFSTRKYVLGFVSGNGPVLNRVRRVCVLRVRASEVFWRFF